MNRWRTIACLCLVSVGHESHQIHEYMTDEEVQTVFQTDRHSVPEYEVVPIAHYFPNNWNGKQNVVVYFKAFGEDVTLHLDEAKDVLFSTSTPIYTVSSNTSYLNGLNYRLVSDEGLKKRFKIYEDQTRMASVAAYEGEDEKFHFNGPYGKNFIIRSLPHRVLGLVNNNKTYEASKAWSRVPEYGDYAKIPNHHVVVKFPTENLIRHQEEPHEEDFPNKKISGKNKMWGNVAWAEVPPKVIYPEIMVIVDYDSFKSLNFNLWQTVVYYAAFFNAVDLKYRTLKKPKVRFSIVGIIVAVDEGATPYLNENRVKPDLIETGSLDDLSLYLYKETRFSRNSYDAVIAITHSHMCQYVKNSRKLSDCHGVRGIGKYGTACDWDDETERMESVAVIHDRGFSGIATAVHELAHLFGVPHDGSPSLSYVGGPGAARCKWEDGYLMSSFRHDENALKWSKCSQACFRYFLNTHRASCLHNRPVNAAASLPRILPGKLLSIDEQCFRAIGGESCWHDDEHVCTLLWCRVPNTNSDCIASTPAAEGSKCGNGKVCLRGQCVNESSAISKNSQESWNIRRQV